MEINLSDIKANNFILSATYYEQKALGKSPFTLVKGALVRWDGVKSLSADAIYLTEQEYADACKRLEVIGADSQWLLEKGIRVKTQMA